jgi:DNA-binding transcriptional LysR family regulator
MGPTFDEAMLSSVNVLRAAAVTGSFTKASELLDMTQSGVSRAIARLEDRLGVRLFERTPRKLRLTDAGREFYERVVPHLDALDEAAQEATVGAQSVRGRLRVNVDPLFSRLVLGPRVGDFLVAHPSVQLEITTSTAMPDLIASGTDVAIRFGRPQDSGLVARKLLETRIITAAAPEYLAKRPAPRHPNDLESGEHECIQFRDPLTDRAFAWEFHQRRNRLVLHPPGRLMVNDAATHQAACMAGHGIAQLMELAIGIHLGSGRLVDIFPEWGDERFPLFCIYPSRLHLPTKTRAFVDYVASLAVLESAEDPS